MFHDFGSPERNEANRDHDPPTEDDAFPAHNPANRACECFECYTLGPVKPAAVVTDEPTKAERRMQQALDLYRWLETEQRHAWQAEEMTWYARFDRARREMWHVLAWWEAKVEEQDSMRWSGYFKPAA